MPPFASRRWLTSVWTPALLMMLTVACPPAPAPLGAIVPPPEGN
jgi:hypothetical protein